MKLINLGKWRGPDIDGLLAEVGRIPEAGERIAYISEQFLGTPYQEGTLVGDAEMPEQFVVNLAAVDCFTFLDYVEVMRLSGSFDEFAANLKCIRYRDGVVAYRNRRHFFTDWVEALPPHVKDATADAGRGREVTVLKRLNLKADGSLFLEGIDVRERQVTYIPSRFIDAEVTQRIRTGDYVGIYAPEEGLDVTHVGIAIRAGSRIIFRHASSHEYRRSVVDEDLAGYLAGKPGVLVLRPLTAR
jgi:hypothetical protein